MTGGYKMHLEITWTFCCTLSSPVCHVFPKALDKYCLLSILIPLICHFSTIFTIPYVSCIPCPMSDVTCHMSHVTCHFFYKGVKLVCWNALNPNIYFSGAYFQKLDLVRYKFLSNLYLYVFCSFGSSIFHCYI